MHLNEITKSSDLVYQAKIFHVTKDTAELEDGKIVQRGTPQRWCLRCSADRTADRSDGTTVPLSVP